jgi:hypothetical protein
MDSAAYSNGSEIVKKLDRAAIFAYIANRSADIRAQPHYKRTPLSADIKWAVLSAVMRDITS